MLREVTPNHVYTFCTTCKEPVNVVVPSPRHHDMMCAVEVELHAFLTSAINGSE
jgi:hypothetical protein